MSGCLITSKNGYKKNYQSRIGLRSVSCLRTLCLYASVSDEGKSDFF